MYKDLNNRSILDFSMKGEKRKYFTEWYDIFLRAYLEIYLTFRTFTEYYFIMSTKDTKRTIVTNQ